MKQQLQSIIHYILSVLLQGEKQVDKVVYSKTLSDTAAVTILASDFFDEGVYLTERSMPILPLECWHGIPVLFGTPEEEEVDGRKVIHADILASAFFLMSRYEELINPQNKDIWGRFTGLGSLPSRAGFLERPVVDEYGKCLREILRKAEIPVKEPEKPGTIYLTHDVDVPWKRWRLISALRNSVGHTKLEHRLTLWPLRNFFGDYSYNPFDTFDWMLEQDRMAKMALGSFCQDIYFVIATTESDSFTESYIKDKKARPLLYKLMEQASSVGLHISYDSGKASDKHSIQKEKELLEDILQRPITNNRNHYLLSSEPSAFRDLIALGITDDYTMGYADHIGFRLGTAQCVRWIDPERIELTDLWLHPLIVMDGSLVAQQYMGIKKSEAIDRIKSVYKSCRSVNGDFCVLFHNSIFRQGNYRWMEDVYRELIHMLCLDAENVLKAFKEQ